MAKVEFGMNYLQFFHQNKEELKSLPKEQRQKIANFWKSDVDGIISNEIEQALLKGFTSKSGKVSMPAENPTLFKERQEYDDCNIDVFQRSDYEIRYSKQKDNSVTEVCCDVFAVNENHLYFHADQDHLYDVDGDGIPDKRVLFVNHVVRQDVYIDNNLDGNFDEIIYDNRSNTKEINEDLMSGDDK